MMITIARNLPAESWRKHADKDHQYDELADEPADDVLAEHAGGNQYHDESANLPMPTWKNTPTRFTSTMNLPTTSRMNMPMRATSHQHVEPADVLEEHADKNHVHDEPADVALEEHADGEPCQ